MPEMIEIQCPKCQVKANYPAPIVEQFHTPNFSQIILVSPWNADQRKCPGCGVIIAPVIAGIQNGFAAFDPPKDESKIIVPHMQVPRDLKRVG
jgi:hypothetical protein